MSDIPTFRLGDLVWIAEAVNDGKDFALRHGIVKRVAWNGLRVTVAWIDTDRLEYTTTEHPAAILAVTADEAIQKFLDWAKSVLNSRKRIYEKEAVEKRAKAHATAVEAIVVHKLDEDQLSRIIAAIKEKP